MNKSICIYCGSSDGTDSGYLRGAADLTSALTDRGFGIVYGGGFHGLMGEVANAALKKGATLEGVIPARFRSDRTQAPEGAKYYFVDSMQERKALLRDLASGFVALPGGIGTLDEITETLMLRSLGFHKKPLALLDTGGFYTSLIATMEKLVSTGFMKRDLFRSIFISADPGAVAEWLDSMTGTEEMQP